ncbi:MAG: fimbrillin family protein, partial [Bacteroidaceae bacterium]|nr:fimbrillin family protein [Bacteroidaceae bacterium]
AKRNDTLGINEIENKERPTGAKEYIKDLRKRILTTTAAMALLAACSTNDEIQAPQQEMSSIDFATYAPTMTRAADNSSATQADLLNTHHTTFKVWGNKTVGTTKTEVFNDQLVSYNGSKWTYDPLRYWDKTARYNFYAVAPAKNSTSDINWSFSDEKFSLSNFTLQGTSLPVSSNLEPETSFKDVTDVDLMLAHDITNYSNYGTVALEFDHILSCFNIGVKATSPNQNHTITVNEVKVFNLNMKGDFNENTTGLADNELKNGTTKRWSNTSEPTSGVGYSYESGTQDFTTEKFVYRALVIPQEVAYENLSLSGPSNPSTAKPYLMVKYTMDYGNNTTESFTSYYNLAAAFGKTTAGDKLPFNEGWMNTLHITLGPETIEFSGQVNQFAAQSSVNIPPTNGN